MIHFTVLANKNPCRLKKVKWKSSKRRKYFSCSTQASAMAVGILKPKSGAHFLMDPFSLINFGNWPQCDLVFRCRTHSEPIHRRHHPQSKTWSVCFCTWPADCGWNELSYSCLSSEMKCFLFFAAYVICKKNYSFSRVVFLFFSDQNCQLFLFKTKWQQ